MPIVKHIAVHKHPLALIRYILNGDKNDEMKYASGLNCSANTEAAYEEFKSVFETFSGERFYKESFDYSDDENIRSKEKIRLHHYIQSFAPGETTPEEAHKIGVEWAKRVFGNNHQVLISTHLDKGHIHNHFSVAAYDLKGKKWCDNKKSLDYCRSISDKLAREQGLSVIEKPQYKADHKYSDWIAKQSGTSWKQKICDDIDRLVLREDVKSVNDLAKQLRKIGYEVRHGKYLAIKAAKNRKAVRSYRLGNGYAVEELEYRIENKNREISLSAISEYTGIQREYAMCLRELQIMVYRKSEKTYNATFSEIRRNSELLTFLCDNNIHSEEGFRNIVNAAAEKTDSLKKSRDKLLREISEKEKILKDGARFIELNKIKMPTAEEIKELREMKYLSALNISSEADIEKHREALGQLRSELDKTEKELADSTVEKREAAENYKTYMRQMQSDYDFILERLKREKEEADRNDEIREQQERQEETRTYREER